MSIKRYQPVAQCVEPSYQAQMVEPKVMEFSEGEYVLHSDYARLKAEVERLTFDPLTYLDDLGEWMPRHIHLAAVERLKAENERLRKAGDVMEQRLLLWHNDDYSSIWNAAKDGKPSV